MQGIILAAGMGKRLGELTKENTKCMVRVNGVTLIERMLKALDELKLSRVVIVVGYEGEKLKAYINSLDIQTPVEFVENPIYDKTNNIYSLSLAGEYLEREDTLLLESDIIFEPSVLKELVEDPRESLAVVDKFASWMDGTCMTLDGDDCIVDFISGKHLSYSDKENYYKTVNIYKFSRDFSTRFFVPFMTAYEKAMGENSYYESVIKLIAVLGKTEIRAKRLNGQVWYEIDDVQDLNIAESLFAATPEEQYDLLASRYGGYWRYPKLLDYCYLVNPYYPNKKMSEEIKSNFETLLAQYPSGMFVNSLLAAKDFGLSQKHIVVGNGAAELIKGFMEHIDGKVGVIRPTFEEYPNRYDRNQTVEYSCVENEFSYDEQDLMDFFGNKDIQTLILINPDNPTGNYISVDGLLRLIEWAKSKELHLVVDESFVDFARTEEGTESTTLLKEDILGLYSGLYVVKSISKSYGVPGIRLGILATGDEKMIELLKKEVAIWNINSYGEFFLQIMDKYKGEYLESLAKIKDSRDKMIEGLKTVPYLKVYPSQANYVMCRVIGKSSREICSRLLQEQIFIKDLTKKIGDGNQYIRLAVRTVEENEKLVQALLKI